MYARDHSNAVPCCVTDIGTGRIWWEWRQGHWIIAVKPDSAPAQKRHKADRHGIAEAILSNEHDSEPLRNLPDLSWVGSMAHSAQEGLS